MNLTADLIRTSGDEAEMAVIAAAGLPAPNPRQHEKSPAELAARYCRRIIAACRIPFLPVSIALAKRATAGAE